MPVITKSTLVSLAEAALITGYTKAWLLQLSKSGFFAKQRRGEYLLFEVVQGVQRHLSAEKKNASQTNALTRMQNARAREIEQRTLRNAGDLFHRDVVFPFIAECIGTFLLKLDGLPAEVTRDLTLRRQIEAIIGRMRNEHARWMQEKAEGAEFKQEPALDDTDDE